MLIRHRACPERIGLDNRLKPVSFDHSDDRINKLFCWAVFSYIYMYLVVPENFLSQTISKARADFLCERDRIYRFLIDAVAECLETLRLRFFPKVYRPVPHPPHRYCFDQFNGAWRRGGGSDADLIFF